MLGRPGCARAPCHEEDDEDDDRQPEPVVGLGVEHAEVAGRARRRVRDVRDAAGPAEPVRVVGRDADDLAEAERDDGEVVAA